MGKHIAVTDNGVHKNGKKVFLTDTNRVHRKVKKMFLTKDGVHRLVYSSGTKWLKYSCNTGSSFGDYTQVDTDSSGNSIGDTTTATAYMITYSADYNFSPSEGFSMAGFIGQADNVVELGSVSGYIVGVTEVWSILSVDIIREYPDGSFTAEVSSELVALCEPSEETTTYSKGSKSYGVIEVEDGVLPEGGELIAGSANDSHCVLSINGILYYYERGD